MYDKSRITRVLAKSIAELGEFMEQGNSDRYFAVDCEATSLDTRIAKLVGISICINGDHALYAPTGHRGYSQNLDPKLVVAVLDKKVKEGYVPVYYNSKYDLNVIQANTGWHPGDGNHLDVLELVYLDNPDRTEKNLKLVALEDLQYEMATFESLFAPEEVRAKAMNIATKTPGHVLEYATDDSIATRLLLTKYRPILKEFAFAVSVDTKIVDIIRRVEHNGGMEINRGYIDEQIDLLEKRAQVLRQIVHRVVGYSFEIGSPKALGIALFDKLGLPSPGQTKKGQHKTDAESLELLAVQYPVAEYVVSYRKLIKAKGTYFEKLKRLSETKKPVRFSFHIYAAPTFRFAAPGGDPDRDGMTGVNIQAVSNGEERELPAVSLFREREESSYLEEMAADDFLVDLRHEGVGDVVKVPLLSTELKQLPWVVQNVEGEHFCILEDCQKGGCLGGCAQQGLDTVRRPTKNLRMVPSVRQAFKAPEGFSLVSFDYERQELVIGANLSGEPNWIGPLSRKEDLHRQSTITCYELDPAVYDALSPEEKRAKREVGKIVNFAIFYGATGYTISRKANLPPAQGNMIYDNYRRNNPTLFSWIAKVHLFARKNGFTTTYFGRRRRLDQFYREADSLDRAGRRKEAAQMRAFADRSSVNTAVQGTGAEVTRIGMVKTAAKLKKEGLTRKEVFLVMQIHDELDFCIRTELIPEVAPHIISSMAFHVAKWKVQLSCSYKVGQVWGLQS